MRDVLITLWLTGLALLPLGAFCDCAVPGTGSDPPGGMAPARESPRPPGSTPRRSPPAPRATLPDRAQGTACHTPASAALPSSALLPEGGRQAPWLGVAALAVMLAWTTWRLERRVRAEARRRIEADAALEAASRALRLLSACNQVVSRATGEQALLDDVCRSIAEAGGYPLAWVGYAGAAPARRLEPVACAGPGVAYLDGVVVGWGDDSAGQGPAGSAVRLGRPVVVRDALTDPTFAPWREQAQAFGWRSVVGLPLFSGGRAFGALTIYSTRADDFSPATVNALVELAGNVSHGLSALRVRCDQRRIERSLWEGQLRHKTLNRLLRLAFDPLPLPVLLDRALAEVLAAPWLPLGRGGAVLLAREAPRRPPLRVVRDLPEGLDLALGEMLDACEGPGRLGMCLESPRAACTLPSDEVPAASLYCWVPILSAGRALGVLALTLSGEAGAASGLDSGQDALAAAASTLATIIERKRADEQLGLFSAVFENAAEGVMVTDADNRIVAVNEAFCGITGYAAEDVLGQTPRLLRSDRHDPTFYAGIWEAIQRSSRWQGEIWNRRRSGEVYPEWLSISVIRGPDGAITHHVGVFTDISRLKQSQARLEFLAHHDGLTELPNRLLLGARLEHALDRARRQGQLVALVFLDLDRFKAVNDTFGHLAGDRLLQQVALRLRGCVRQDDTVARLAGDEFVLLLEGLTKPADAARVALKVLASLAAPIDVGPDQIAVTASIGIAVYPADGIDGTTLLSRADEALYRAKAEGRQTYAFYDPSMDVPDAEMTIPLPRRRG